MLIQSFRYFFMAYIHIFGLFFIFQLTYTHAAGGHKDCRFGVRGEEYKGTKSITKSGKKCQHWISQKPNEHNTNPYDMPDWDLKEAQNYCRNPGGIQQEPWCYIASSQGNETCDVPMCECKDTLNGWEYIGKIARTTSGKQCQKWKDQRHGFTADDFPDKTLAHNYCRNPDRKRNGPWCYLTESINWEYCDIPICECKMTEDGEWYTGTKNTTITGIPCQPWNSQKPHRHSRSHLDFFLDNSISEAKNYCRNPDKEPIGPWCYTMDKKVRFQPCGIPYCRTATRKPRPKLHSKVVGLYNCQMSKMGLEYKGHVIQSGSNKRCQRWDTQNPNKHNQTDISKYPEANLKETSNYCRNPDASLGGPWCYVDGGRENCNITQCDCKPSNKGLDYIGTLSKTVTGLDCQRWDINTPHSHPPYKDKDFPDQTVAAANNYCRNPTGVDQRYVGPWCYTTDPVIKWEYCNLELCECKKTKLGKEYMGRVNFTRSGRPCQHWASMYPHVNFHINERDIPDRSVPAAENFCRNPDNEPNGPWCYTLDPATRWEYCHIEFCRNYPKRLDRPLEKSSGLSAGKVIGIVLAVAAGLLIIGASIFYWKKKKGKISQLL